MKEFYPEEKDEAGPIRKLLQNAFLVKGKKPPAVTEEDVRKRNTKRIKTGNTPQSEMMRQISSE